MAQRKDIDKKTFLRMAAMAGLDPDDRHMEELYAHVLGVRSSLKLLKELEVPDSTEPVMPFIPR